MDYKPDKFDKVATKVVAIILIIICVPILLMIFTIRFSGYGEGVLTTENLIRGGTILLIIGVLGFTFARSNKNDEDD